MTTEPQQRSGEERAMKCIGFVTAAALLALAISPPAQATTLASANASVTFDGPFDPPVTDSDGMTGPGSATAGASLASAQADAAAFADFGILRAFAFISRGADSTASAQAFANYDDTLTISSAGFNGQTTNMTISVAVEGYLDPLGATTSEFRHSLRFEGLKNGFVVLNTMDVIYRGSDQDGNLNPQFRSGLGPGDFSFQPGDPFFVSAVRDIQIQFIMGNTITIRGALNVDANSDLLNPALVGSADVNFFNTSKWNGIKSIEAVDPTSGELVSLDPSQLQFSSGSGVDYRNAIVPEPGTVLLVAGPLTVLAAVRRRTGR